MYFDGNGNTQRGWRPGIVFQNNIGNTFSPNIIALPLTSSLKKVNQPTHVVLDAKNTGLFRDSMVLCENPACISKEMVGDYITTIPDHYMKRIAEASLLATSAITYLDKDSLLDIWNRASDMC
jgi:mRNA interferase MazF